MDKDDSFWVNTVYIALAVIAGYVGYQAINTVGVQMSLIERYDSWFPMVNNIGAVVFGAAIILWFRSDKQRRDYHLASVAEARKVTWPSLPDTKRMTIVVVVVVAVFAVILGVFDLVWSWALKLIIT
ncbi:MAG: preprotein translocase subunit SecE [Bdellovibrionota bacterium]